MSDITVVYWRDIPAQVIVGKGRKATKKPLSERFEQAIDRAAMRSGAAGTDAYLAQWRKAPFALPDAKADTTDPAASAATWIEAHYDTDHLKRLIDNDGWV
jgi:hypothetical protein